MMYDKLLYFAVAIIIGYSINYLVAYIKKCKRRRPEKAAPQKRPVSEKAAMLCRYSDQCLRLNMMALEAVRELSATAAKGKKVAK